MSIARRRRRRHLRWCRYIVKVDGEVPTDCWQHRAPSVWEPRPSGVVRAWDRLVLKANGWPWKPWLPTAPSGQCFHRRSSLMAHDLPRGAVKAVRATEEGATDG